MNYADALAPVRTCLLNDATVAAVVSGRVSIEQQDRPPAYPSILIALRSPGKSDFTHAHRRLTVNIRYFSNVNAAAALALQSAAEAALRAAYDAGTLYPITFIEIDTPMPIPANGGWGLSQNFSALAKEVL